MEEKNETILNERYDSKLMLLLDELMADTLLKEWSQIEKDRIKIFALFKEVAK